MVSTRFRDNIGTRCSTPLLTLTETCSREKRKHIFDGQVWKLENARQHRATWSIKALLYSLFLPEGYPDSVTADYLPYQIWDTLQAFASTITGILCTEALLKGMGVGDAEAVASSAILQWVGRDGLGKLGRITFSAVKGSDLDQNAKTWRLIADALNDLGMALELVSPMWPEAFFLFAAAGNVCKSIVGVAGGATRAALTHHFAKRDNFGEVSSKDDSQEMVVGLVGMLFGILASRLLKDASLHLLSFWFFVLVAMHLYCNYRAVSAVCLASFNQNRLDIALQMTRDEGLPPTPAVVQSKENVLWPYPRTKIRLGCSVAEAQRCNGEQLLQQAREGQDIIVVTNGHQGCVLLHHSSDVAQQIRGYIRAWWALNGTSGSQVQQGLSENAILQSFSNAGWRLDVSHLGVGSYRLQKD